MTTTSGYTASEDPDEDGEVEIVDDSRNPSEVMDDYWLYCCRIRSPFRASGKWMLFYRTDQIDAAWARARELYLHDKFTVNSASPLGGVTAMKVATSRDNERASSKATRPIIFYCGELGSEAATLEVGRNILHKMGYQGGGQHPNRCRFVYWKSDLRTREGTRATGCARNWDFRLRFG